MVLSLDGYAAVGTFGTPAKEGLTALTTLPVPVVEISSTFPVPVLILPNTLLALTF